MTHNHDHGHDGHGHCHDEMHDHDHDHPSETGLSDDLFSHIDTQNVTALNVNNEEPVSKIFKPWHERYDETTNIESDADDEMIIRVPFTGSVKLRSILLKAGPAEQTPAKVVLFANQDHMDFDDVRRAAPTQEFEVPQGREIGEYSVKAAKFSNLSSITLYFPESQGGETVQLSYIGFRGDWTELRRDPVITVYEAQANLADHEKIQGMDGVESRLGQ